MECHTATVSVHQPDKQFLGSGFWLHGLCAHVQRSLQRKLADHAQSGVFLRTIDGLYIIHVVNANRVVHSKHVIFEERIFLIKHFKTSIVPDQVIEVHNEHCASDNISRMKLPEIDHAMCE